MRGHIFGVTLVLMAGMGMAADANDSVAEMGTGGLVFVQSDDVSMVSEDLFISEREITVDYVFLNRSGADVTAIVAFPMPELTGNLYEMPSIPFENDDNFLGFSVVVDGRPVMAQLEQRAFALGLDITQMLNSAGIPLMPFGQPVMAALGELPPGGGNAGSGSLLSLADLERHGAIENDRYDVGQGMEDHPTPIWTLKSTYWWEMTFPAGREITVSHRYAPSVGATTMVTFIDPYGKQSYTYDTYIERYCIDAPFINAVKRETAAGSTFYENWISYILKTGQNWYGSIERFHLTVDKGSTRNLVSFCGKGVKKTGPTRFEMTLTDFYPDKDLDILLLKRAE